MDRLSRSLLPVLAGLLVGVAALDGVRLAAMLGPVALAVALVAAVAGGAACAHRLLAGPAPALVRATATAAVTVVAAGRVGSTPWPAELATDAALLAAVVITLTALSTVGALRTPARPTLRLIRGGA
ncbi:MAG: hypothetical protein IT196_03480 [Acidimicrobiales bacterium]|nr:hypothetical protein [Acidimicrobiales bacterium]